MWPFSVTELPPLLIPLFPSYYLPILLYSTFPISLIILTYITCIIYYLYSCLFQLSSRTSHLQGCAYLSAYLWPIPLASLNAFLSLVRTKSSESIVGFPHFPVDELDTISACPIPSKTENQRYFFSLLTTLCYCCFSLFLFTFTTDSQSSLPILSPSSSAYGKFIKSRHTFCPYSRTLTTFLSFSFPILLYPSMPVFYLVAGAGLCQRQQSRLDQSCLIPAWGNCIFLLNIFFKHMGEFMEPFYFFYFFFPPVEMHLYNNFQ